MDRTTDRRLVLASASPARLRLLRQAGFDPEVVVSDVDESAVTAATAQELVAELARRKAAAVAGRVDGWALVVGCDSLFELDGATVGKPATVDEARSRLQAARGRSGVLRTGHCLVDVAGKRSVAEVASTEVRFGDYSDAELDAYLATDEPLRVAGAFTLDGRSAPFVDGVVGDPSNVIGLSLPLLRNLLHRLGLSVVDFWA